MYKVCITFLFSESFALETVAVCFLQTADEWHQKPLLNWYALTLWEQSLWILILEFLEIAGIQLLFSIILFESIPRNNAS
jgi:hypothetical protein